MFFCLDGLDQILNKDPEKGLLYKELSNVSAMDNIIQLNRARKKSKSTWMCSVFSPELLPAINIFTNTCSSQERVDQYIDILHDA